MADKILNKSARNIAKHFAYYTDVHITTSLSGLDMSIIASKHQWHKQAEAKPMMYISRCRPWRPTLSARQTRL